ncbi:mercury methylation corrinoid protein HgcA [Candidatus Eisenbacteria bacterium]|uniref:Mercury methylation corrinoid protein HgcA n=1 Tax=Eiseniibacteriota bacterium TaxID=2212470 RepID=A0ABV6YIG5_UNCEI
MSGPDPTAPPQWTTGLVQTPVGSVHQVSTTLSRADHMGTIKVRLNLGRMTYSVPPGLYAVGNPTEASLVFVSANYKLSFDTLRRNLRTLDAWILVLDTKGVNVWCAAGKGTFSTDELVHRIDVTELARIVSHRRLILPQLGAPGVAAHAVKQRSGFKVVYGPVRADDIQEFIAGDLKATPEMRRVRFDLPDRLVLIPVEMAQWGRYTLLLMAILLLLGGLHRGGYDPSRVLDRGLRSALLLFASYVGSVTLFPILLPWLPGRAFSIRGCILGVILAIGALAVGALSWQGLPATIEAASWFLLIPTMGAFVALNYTGTTTFTSQSGVFREMKFALPLQITGAVAGLGGWIASGFLS